MNAKIWASGALFLQIAALALLLISLSHAADEHEHMHMHAGHDHSAHMAPPPVTDAAESVPVKLSGKPLSDQEGRSLRLKNDVIGERIVVVSFVYTNCTTVCPLSSAIFSELQNKLGSRLDSDVRLVSLTVDPARDTPSQLKNYSAQYGAKPGWLWLTGSQASVTDALMGFGAYTSNFENHPVIVMIGDGKTGKWSRHYGLSSSDSLLARVEEYLAARNKSASHKATTAHAAHDAPT